MGGIFCDISKESDCVDHDILSKIKKYGINGKGKELLQSHITDIYQWVLIENKTNPNTTVSNWARINLQALCVLFIGQAFCSL